MDINYNELSLEQLKEINKKSAAAIADFENRRKKEAIQKATEIAKAAGTDQPQGAHLLARLAADEGER